CGSSNCGSIMRPGVMLGRRSRQPTPTTQPIVSSSNTPTLGKPFISASLVAVVDRRRPIPAAPQAFARAHVRAPENPGWLAGNVGDPLTRVWNCPPPRELIGLRPEDLQPLSRPSHLA